MDAWIHVLNMTRDGSDSLNSLERGLGRMRAVNATVSNAQTLSVISKPLWQPQHDFRHKDHDQ